MSLKRICVYCGSCTGHNPLYVDAAQRLGKAIAGAGYGLVYGGGKAGLMGIVAEAALEHGGNVIGIIPKSLVASENAFYGVSEYHEVNTFHERKLLMSSLADAFMVLPGGPGTLEELVEQLAWAQLGLHEKPLFFINVNGFWNIFLDFLKTLDPPMRLEPAYLVTEEPEQAIDILLNM